jgi:hypothetical protein
LQTLTFNNVDFTGGLTPAESGDWPVQPGDALEINGGGLLYQVLSVNINPPFAQTLTVSRPAYVGALSVDPAPPQSPPGQPLTGYYTTIWRIIRQPRRITGQDSLTLNGNVVVDLTPPGPGVFASLNVPVRSVPTIPPTNPPTYQSYYEILFAPNGGVVGRGTNTGNSIILWVRDSTQTDPTANAPVLIGIQVRTGFVGTYQVDTTTPNDPYSFTRDPRASGM